MRAASRHLTQDSALPLGADKEAGLGQETGSPPSHPAPKNACCPPQLRAGVTSWLAAFSLACVLFF